MLSSGHDMGGSDKLKWAFLLQINVRPHASKPTTLNLKQLNIKVLPHLLHPQISFPTNYHFFRALDVNLRQQSRNVQHVEIVFQKYLSRVVLNFIEKYEAFTRSLAVLFCLWLSWWIKFYFVELFGNYFLDNLIESCRYYGPPFQNYSSFVSGESVAKQTQIQALYNNFHWYTILG